MKTVQQVIDRMETWIAKTDVIINTKKKYNECNLYLPKDLPYITKQEAQKAYKRLVKKFAKKKVWSNLRNKWVTKKQSGLGFYFRKPRRCWICLSGNPSSLSKGWRRLIHDVSHMVHNFLRPNLREHCYQQAELELSMIKFAYDQKWFEGTLKPKIKVISLEEKKDLKIKHLESLVKKWETKNKTTLTYLKKYKAKLKRLKR